MYRAGFAVLLMISFCAEAKTKVLYFVGTGGSQTLANRWAGSAGRQCGNFEFSGFAFEVGSRKISAAASQILKDPGTNYIIACHSSGCAEAANLARQVLRDRAYKGNIKKFASLEGFTLEGSEILDKIPDVGCYNGVNGSIRGRNWGSMSRCGRNHHRTIKNASCSYDWCLHYGLSFTDASSDNRYAGSANLAWLPECRTGIADNRAPAEPPPRQPAPRSNPSAPATVTTAAEQRGGGFLAPSAR